MTVSFNPRAPCGARPVICLRILDSVEVSIHAPRAGRDRLSALAWYGKRVSIHAPRAGRDPSGASPRGTVRSFNPRAPCGARHHLHHRRSAASRFNPRAPCGARRHTDLERSKYMAFQSTRPVRGATLTSCTWSGSRLFQSTRPVRGATTLRNSSGTSSRVSIHAPRAGRDRGRQHHAKGNVSFNPRAPCGARLPASRMVGMNFKFQSTRPVRGATMTRTILLRSLVFQSTRPVRGATANEVTTSLFCHIFMGVTRHKYDFLGILPHAPPPAWFAYLYLFATFSVHFTFALQKNAQMIMADSRS